MLAPHYVSHYLPESRKPRSSRDLVSASSIPLDLCGILDSSLVCSSLILRIACRWCHASFCPSLAHSRRTWSFVYVSSARLFLAFKWAARIHFISLHVGMGIHLSPRAYYLAYIYAISFRSSLASFKDEVIRLLTPSFILQTYDATRFHFISFHFANTCFCLSYSFIYIRQHEIIMANLLVLDLHLLVCPFFVVAQPWPILVQSFGHLTAFC